MLCPHSGHSRTSTPSRSYSLPSEPSVRYGFDSLFPSVLDDSSSFFGWSPFFLSSAVGRSCAWANATSGRALGRGERRRGGRPRHTDERGGRGARAGEEAAAVEPGFELLQDFVVHC